MDDMQRQRESRRSVGSQDMPACQSCRKKKLKCSRDRPTCSQCSRLLYMGLACECVYSHIKQTPGMRPGAVDSLSRRIDALEAILKEKSPQPLVHHHSPSSADAQGCIYHAALLIANQYQYQPQEGISPNFVPSCTATNSDSNPRKRKHQQEDKAQATQNDWDDGLDTLSALPRRDQMDSIVDTYFATVHHWIPLVHRPRLDSRRQHPTEPGVGVLLHAIVVASIHEASKAADFGMSKEAVNKQARRSRQVVMMNAMDELSVENLQALAIIAFDHMGSGHLSRAWPLVASLVKSVEYLQLTVEPDDVSRGSFMRPLVLLAESSSPAETEERRRVFWNIFLLDRFLAVMSGWNPSLTAQDVNRRLPSNGRSWNANESAPTPFFGILDRSTAKIGSPVSSYGSNMRQGSIDEFRAPNHGQSPMCASSLESQHVGALAFRIEATESLSQVTSLFLQQEIDFENREQVSKWLVRFKELDLRLVHWKLFFPQRWGDSNVSKEEKSIEMDPNLTLAHVIHNASLILLHQHIAYPSPELTKRVRLPSSCSADTCLLAAVEISSITGKFLAYINYLVPAQFAFCAFIAARVLLIHWRFYDTELSPEFAVLVQYLQEMSNRWKSTGPQSQYDDPLTDLAAKYVAELQSLHDKCSASPEMCHSILGLPFPAVHDVTHANRHQHTQFSTNGGHAYIFNQLSPNLTQNQLSLFMGRPPATYPAISPTGEQMASGSDGWGDELAVVSRTLLDQQFADMDRVFTLSGTDFAFNMGDWDAITKDN